MKKFMFALSGSLCSLALSACVQNHELSLQGDYSQENALSYQADSGSQVELSGSFDKQSAVLLDDSGEAKLQLASGAIIPLHIASTAIVNTIENNEVLKLHPDEVQQNFGIEIGVHDRLILAKEESVEEDCDNRQGKQQVVYRHETMAKQLELYLVKDVDSDVLANFDGILSTSERKVLVRASACSQSPQSPGRNLPGRDQTGRPQPGRDQPGRDLPGRDLPGRQLPGR